MLRILRWEYYLGGPLMESYRKTYEECRRRSDTEEKAIWPARQKVEGCGHKPSTTSSHQKVEEARVRWPLRASSGEGNGNPLQSSCLENPMDGGAWWAAVHGIAKSRTRLSDFTLTFHFHALEKEMATHSSVLAWRIPGTGEPGGPPSMGRTESDTIEVT